ncbi:MAG: histidine kinase [Porticoccaceae bacterium]|nr:histidine kinase [Porticoccaceae bacterium]
MKLTKKALSRCLSAAVFLGVGLAASSRTLAGEEVLAPEVSASAAVASTYLWRGYDVGSGTPAVSGDLVVSHGGAYAGIWGSSGDTSAGSEYNIFAGYAFEVGGLTVDLSVWNWIYPTTSTIGGENARFGDISEVVLGLGYGRFRFAYYDNVAGDSGYGYYTLGADLGPFSLLVGQHNVPGGDDPVHVDLSYAYNNNLSFTLSQFVSDEPADDNLKFVVAYSFPINL